MANSNRRVVKTKPNLHDPSTGIKSPVISETFSLSDRITIRLDDRMRGIVENIATIERKSASQIVREALYEYLEAIAETG